MHKIYLPTIQQMKLFESVARLKSMTRAAEEVSLTQPSVSMQIRSMEEKIGLPLIEQIGKQLYLTRAGEEVLATCQDVLARLAAMKSNLAHLDNEIAGVLSLGVVSSAKYVLPQIIGEFKRAFPRVEPRVTLANREEIIRRIQSNRDDLYVMGTPPEQSALVSTEFLDNEIVFVATPYHPLASQKTLTLKQIVQADIISRERGSGTRSAIERRLAGENLRLIPHMEFEDSEAIKLAALSGLGIAYVSLHAMRLELAARELVILDVADFPLRRKWYVMHHQAKQLTPVATRFREFLLASGQRGSDPQMG